MDFLIISDKYLTTVIIFYRLDISHILLNEHIQTFKGQNKMKILIVDDSKAMRLMVVHNIKQAGFTGHKTIEYANGEEALNHLASDIPDVIISDWNMPKLTGYELLKAINEKVKNNEIKKPIPFIFVTSESTDDMKKKGMEAGALGIITKPFNVDDFEHTLKNILD